jgi:hypothetical protein
MISICLSGWNCLKRPLAISSNHSLEARSTRIGEVESPVPAQATQLGRTTRRSGYTLL